MTEPDYRTISTIVIGGLLLSVFLLPDLVAVVVIVATLSGVALRDLQEQNPGMQGQPWRRGEHWR